MEYLYSFSSLTDAFLLQQIQDRRITSHSSSTLPSTPPVIFRISRVISNIKYKLSCIMMISFQSILLENYSPL